MSAEQAEPLIQLRDLKKTYPGRGDQVVAVNNISLDVQPGEFVALQGHSGSGKTTVLLMAGGLLAPDSGEVQVAGQQPYSMSPEERAQFRAQHIGFVFQQFHLVPYLSVRANVLTPALAAEVNNAEERADALLHQLGLSQRKGHRPSELSTGERQRTALARALLLEPQVLLADEPTGNLDDDNAKSVLGYLREFAENGGAVLLVTHDARVASGADRSIYLEAGQICEPTGSS